MPRWMKRWRATPTRTHQITSGRTKMRICSRNRKSSRPAVSAQFFHPKKTKHFLSPRLVTSPEWMNRNVNHSDSSEQKKLKRNPPIWIFIRCKWVGFCVWPRPDHDPCKWSGASYANEPSYANILQPLGLKVDSINAKYVQHVEFCWFKKLEN